MSSVGQLVACPKQARMLVLQLDDRYLPIEEIIMDFVAFFSSIHILI